MLDSAPAVRRFPQNSARDNDYPRLSLQNALSTFYQWVHLRSSFRFLPDTAEPCRFLNAHNEWLLTTAARRFAGYLCRPATRGFFLMTRTDCPPTIVGIVDDLGAKTLVVPQRLPPQHEPTHLEVRQ